mgnify:CR=1 FL=1
MTASPSFSIITVCRNAQELIGDTVQSLADQTIRDFEYLVIDALSTDDTLGEVRRHAAALPLKIVSEPDQGIYDAMNKGVRLGTGQWIYFLNAGDRFADTHVLERVASGVREAPDAELAYGDAIYCYGDTQRLVSFEWLTPRNLPFEHLCHQAVFGRRSLFDRIGGFDIQYRLNADFDWLLRAFRSGARHAYLGFPIVLYDTEGVSEKQEDFRRAERKRVRTRYLPRLFGEPMFWGYRGYRKALRLAGLSER